MVFHTSLAGLGTHLGKQGLSKAGTSWKGIPHKRENRSSAVWFSRSQLTLLTSLNFLKKKGSLPALKSKV